MKKIFKVENIPYFVLMLLMLLIFKNRVITPGDDQWFSSILNDLFNDNLIDYLKHRYTNWTGRIIIEAIMVPMFGYNLWIWRIMNSIFTGILAFAIYNLIPYSYISQITIKKRIIIKILICILIFSINKNVFLTSISWITGSFNYLWPVTCALLTIIPFKRILFKEEFNKKWYILLVPITVLSANMEQASLVILFFAILTNIYLFIRDRKLRVHLIIFNFFIAINTAILFLAPGNYNRSSQEIITWFKQWDMISLPNKVMLGTNLFLTHIFEKDIILILVLVASINIVIWKKYKNILIKILAFVPMIIVSIKLLQQVFSIFNININLAIFRILTVENLNISNFNNIRLFLPTAILICTILIVPIIFLFIFDKMEMKYLSIILYLAAICSALAISVSPTIYASGERVFFVTDILLIIIIVLILNEFLRKWSINIYLMLLFIILSGNSFILYIRKILE